MNILLKGDCYAHWKLIICVCVCISVYMCV